MTLWPEGSQLAVGLWLDQPVGPSALLAVGDVLQEGGATYNGALMVADPEQRFAWIGDLDNARWDDGLTESQVREHVLAGRVYRLGMTLPGIGPAMITFEGTPEGETPVDRHPIVIRVESGAFGIPRELWEDEDREEARAMQSVMLRHLQACCRSLDPAYATVGGDGGITPTPAGLADKASLAPDAYIAHRFTRHPGLREPLTTVESVTDVLRWPTGTYYSGWFVAGESDWQAVADAWAPASAALGRILQEH